MPAPVVLPVETAPKAPEPSVPTIPDATPDDLASLVNDQDFQAAPYGKRIEAINQIGQGIVQHLQKQPDFNENTAGEFAGLINDAYAKAAPPAPQGPWESMWTPVKENEPAAAAGTGAGIGAGALAAETGPGAIVADLAASSAASAATQYGIDAARGPVATRRAQEQLEANARAHPWTSAAGNAVPFITSMVNPTNWFKKPIEGILEATGKRVARRVIGSATGGARAGGIKAAGEWANGSANLIDIPKEMVHDAATMAPLGFIGPAKNILMAMGLKAPAEATVAATSEAIYQRVVNDKPLDLKEITHGSVSDIPGFVLLNALAGMLHSRAQIDRASKTADTDSINGSVDAATPGTGMFQKMRGVVNAYLGKTMAKTTARDQQAGELGARWLSSKISAILSADAYTQKVLADSRIDVHKFGAALVEDNLLSVRDGLLKEKDFAAAKRVESIIGAKDSPFRSFKEFRDFINNPAVRDALERHKQLWEDTVDPMYRNAASIDPNEPLPTRGKYTGARINLFNDPDNKASSVVGNVEGPQIQPSNPVQNFREQFLKEQVSTANIPAESPLGKRIANGEAQIFKTSYGIGVPVEEVHRNSLADILPEGTREVFSETSLDSAKRILARTQEGARSHSDIWVSPENHLALGQGGKGTILVFDPTKINGHKPRNLANQVLEGSGQTPGEFVVDKTVPSAVTGVIVRSIKHIDSLKKLRGFEKLFDVEHPEQTERGLLIKRRQKIIPPDIQASNAEDGLQITSAAVKRASAILSKTRIGRLLLRRIQIVPDWQRAIQSRSFSPEEMEIIKRAEGFHDPQTGKSVVITENIRPHDGETPEAAVIRVITHELEGHERNNWMRAHDSDYNRRYLNIARKIPKAELDALLRLYPQYKGNPDALAAEWFAQKAQSLGQGELPDPQSLLGQLWRAIREFLKRLTGQEKGLDQQVRRLIIEGRRTPESLEGSGGVEGEIEPQASKGKTLMDQDADDLLYITDGFVAQAKSYTDAQLLRRLEINAAAMRAKLEGRSPVKFASTPFNRYAIGVFYKEALDRGLKIPKSDVLDAYVGNTTNLQASVPKQERRFSTGNPSGKLTNTFRKKSPFARQAFGTGKSYNINYAEQMRNTFARQLETANKNAFEKRLVETGNAVEGPPGQSPVLADGETTIPYDLKRSTIIRRGKDAIPVNRVLYVRKSLAGEYLRAADATPKDIPKSAKIVTAILNHSALAGLTDGTVHVTNLLTALLTRPGASAGVLSDTLLSAMARADIPITILKTIRKAFQDNRLQIAKLSEIGAMKAKGPHTSWFFLSNVLGRFIENADRTVRLAMDDMFTKMAKQGLVKDTETNRREFVNQVGQYNLRAQGALKRGVRRWGISPFVTAGTTFNTLGLRTLTLRSGAEATSPGAAAMLGVNVLAKWTGAAVMAGTLNYLFTKDKGGGVFGRPGVPLGKVDTGLNDKNGNPLSFPLFDLLGLGRPLRVVGARGFIEARRKGLPVQTSVDAAVRDIVNTNSSPFMGPVLRFGVVTATGYQPAIKTPKEAEPTAPGESEILNNFKAAIKDANPILKSYLLSQEPGQGIASALAQQIPRFSLTPSQPPDMMADYPAIVRRAQASQFMEDVIARARKMGMDERVKFVNESLNRLSPEDRAHAMRTLKQRKVFVR